MNTLARLGMRTSALALLAALPFTSSAFAAGYAIKETSPSLQGMAYAGAAAGGDDISAMYNNPATIGFHSGTNAAGGLSIIYPSGEFSNVSNSTIAGVVNTKNGESEELALVPSAYISHSLNEKLSLGVGITAPFGLVTDYDDDWGGRYHGTYSELVNLNFNPVIAYKPTPKISLALGGVVSYAEADLRNAVDFRSIAAATANPAAALAEDGYAKVEGDDIAFGFTAGVIVRPTDKFRFGIGYRSEIDHDLEGDFRMDTRGNGVNAAIANAAGLIDQGASASATLPQQVNIGASYDVTDRLTIAAEADWTDWSVFDQLVIKGDVRETLSTTDEEFEDSWFFSIGASYDMTDEMTLKLGLAHDQGAAQSEHRTPRLPDADRIWLSAGIGYDLNDQISLDLGYTYVHVDDIDLSLNGTGNDALRGSLSASGDTDIHILTLGGTYHF